MIGRGPVILLLATVTIPVAVAAAQLLGPGPSTDMQAAEGYSRIVNEVFIRRLWLESDGQKVKLTPAAQETKAAVAFDKASYLGEDRKSVDRWRIENGVVVELSPSIHNRPLPFRTTRTWLGELDFRDAPRIATLTSPNGRLQLGDGPNLDQPARANLLARTFSAQGDRINLYAGEPAQTKNWVATLFRIGDATIVQAKGGGQVRVEGRLVGNNQYGVLEPGSRMVITMRGTQRSLVSNGVGGTAISLAQPLSDRYHLDGFEAFSGAFEEAANQAVALGLPARTTFATSLDYELQTRLQKQLTDFCAGAGRFRAAVTVMDAVTGEILAVASYAPDAKEGESPINQNFRAMPIGSAAKPLITAAILAERPGLATFKADSGGATIDSVYGLSLAQPVNEEAAGLSGKIGLNEFIKYSSNRYATSLMLAASTPRGRPIPEDGINPADVGFEVMPVDGKRVIDQQKGKIEWLRHLKSLFGIEYERVSDPSSTNRYADDTSDMTAWRDLIGNEYLRRRTPLLVGLRRISPVSMNFATNQSHSFRSDYLQMMLGGQNYSWTPVKVAESYARIVTGQKVEASMLQARTGKTGWPSLDPALDPAARLSLVHAMSLPVQPGGTAASLGPILSGLSAQASSRGEELRFYGKTGSPRLETPVTTAKERAENALIHDKLLVVSRDASAISLKTTQGEWVLNGSTLRAAQRALEADPKGRTILREHRVSARQALERAVRYNADPMLNLYRIDNGVLVRVAGEGALTGSDVKAFAFVVGRYSPGTPLGGTPKRAIAVSVNIQRQWMDGNEAVVFSECALPTVLAPILFDDAGAARQATARCEGLQVR